MQTLHRNRPECEQNRLTRSVNYDCPDDYIIEFDKYIPMSVPIPIELARKASRAPSPPDDPPHERFILQGFKVRPMMLLIVSPSYILYEHNMSFADSRAYALMDDH